MKTACLTQCAECPFRRNAIPGYLGAYTPSEVFESIWRSVPFFCHPKINYERKDWEKKAAKDGRLCLGSMVFAKKMMAPTRPDSYPETDAEVLAARTQNENRTDVDCMTPREFMEWHKPENISANMKIKMSKSPSKSVAARPSPASVPSESDEVCEELLQLLDDLCGDLTESSYREVLEDLAASIETRLRVANEEEEDPDERSSET